MRPRPRRTTAISPAHTSSSSRRACEPILKFTNIVMLLNNIWALSRLLQHVKESREYKTEAQKASHGALYRVVQDYLLGVCR